jgi:hypothetical protein
LENFEAQMDTQQTLNKQAAIQPKHEMPRHSGDGMHCQTKTEHLKLDPKLNSNPMCGIGTVS